MREVILTSMEANTRYHARSSRSRLAVTALMGLGLAACQSTDRPSEAPEALHGPELTQPIAKPDFTLLALDGTAYDFRKETEGYLTLLFFGYTHCPDVCPVHMANLGAVVKRLPNTVTERLKVIFVTTDPDRDTPERLREWLDGFDPSFIGLTGSQASLAIAQSAARVQPAFRDTTATSTEPGEYFIGHAAQVIAYTPDNLVHAMYPWGIRQEDWAHDIPLLLERWPNPTK